MKTIVTGFLLAVGFLATAMPRPIVGSWQSISNWQRQVVDGRISFISRLPQAGTDAKGLTLVFVKGYNCSKTLMPEKPLPLPFLFWSDDHTAYEWRLDVADKVPVLVTRMSANCEAAYVPKQSGILYRQFYFDAQFLKEKNLTPVAVKKLSYRQVVELTGVAE